MLRFRVGGIWAVAALLVATACSNSGNGGPPRAVEARGLVQAPTNDQRTAVLPSSPGDTTTVRDDVEGSVRPARRGARAITEGVALVPDGAVVVAPDGTKQGHGTLGDPFDLASVLAGRRARPGMDTVMLRGGVYRGTFESRLRGTATKPITIQSFPGEWAVIDAGTSRSAALTINGPYATFRDLEVMHSLPAGEARSSRFRPGPGVQAVTKGTKLIGLVVHDNATGIEITVDAPDAEVNGAVVYNNGYVDRGPVGSGIDIENGDGTKLVENSFVFNNFGDGINVNGTLYNLSKVVLKGVVAFDNGSPAATRQPNVVVGTSTEPADHLRIEDGVFYHRTDAGPNVELGYRTTWNTAASVIDNTFVGGQRLLSLENWGTVDVRENVFGMAHPTAQEGSVIDLWTPEWLFRDSPVPDTYRWDDNAYVGLAAADRRFNVDRSAEAAPFTFEAWKGRTGFDGSSAITSALTAPVVSVLPSAHAPGRAHLVVYDATPAAEAEVDLSDAGLPVGSRFEIRDVQDLSRPPVVSGTYDGSPVRVPMRGETVAQPYAAESDLRHTPSSLGTFVVLPLGPA